MREYIKMWKGTFDFKGRSTKSEYWFAVLIHVLIVGLLFFVGFFLANTPLESGFTRFLVLYMVIASIPWISLGVRRLHDVDRSGVLLLLIFLPFGNIALLYYLCQDTKEGFNKWVQDKNAVKDRNDERYD